MSKTTDASIVWCDREELHSTAASFIKPASSVLDIGCGIRPQQYITPELLICIEPHLEYVEILKKSLKDANAVVIPLDAKKALAGMPDRSIDSIFLIDVIEHMEKEIGAEVLLECERVARQQIVIFTPLGFMPQEIHAGDVDGWNLHGGEFQDHKSGWYPEEFAGWDIIACKHLHLQDYLGQDITPPYGGFYAVKNVQKVANHFNDVYARDVIESQTSSLDWLNDAFPLFSEKVVFKDINASHLKCGIYSCQRTTELFIELGATEDQEVIFNKAAAEKSDAMLRETRLHKERIKAFADQFARLNDLSFSLDELAVKAAAFDAKLAELNIREAEVNARGTELSAEVAEFYLKKSELDARDLELEVKKAELDARIVELDQKAAELLIKQLEVTKLAELLDSNKQVINHGLFGKIGLKARALFK
ncbi:methionine biosynthesis protein MetW [Pseudomonas sp. V98_8]|uniref:methyltransferase domain-containing protein n=1 Tax=Pseudomonas sp. V98_8 TaxID=3044228 RepID=UPI00249DD2A7|nr:methionine biosynthesis protein MetW [Pseudomonas sp. V98_8]MDI3394708.1 methionine biosynthesis protein MetW [Pseudomonas sp. V98_8]